MPRRPSKIPKGAVLLIPDPEENEPPSHGVKPGYYNPKQMLHLLDQHKQNADAIHFIADMLETGNPEDDEFAKLLRKHHSDPAAIAQIVKEAAR